MFIGGVENMSKDRIRANSYNIKALPGYVAPKIHKPKPAERVAPHETTSNGIPSAVRPTRAALFATDVIERTLAKLGKHILERDTRFLAAQLLIRDKTAAKAVAKLNSWIKHLVKARQWATTLENKDDVRLARHQIAFLRLTVEQMKSVRTRKGVVYRRMVHLKDLELTVDARRRVLIDRLDKARRKKIKLSKKKKKALRAALKLLRGATKLNGEVHDGSFFFANARLALIKLRITIY